jgi:small subunit ribosomal protein S20
VANIQSAAKRARQAEKRRQLKAAQRSRMRTAIKKVIRAVQAGDAEQAQASYREAVPAIDASAGKGLIHPNKAARHKSRLNRSVSSLQR